MLSRTPRNPWSAFLWVALMVLCITGCSRQPDLRIEQMDSGKPQVYFVCSNPEVPTGDVINLSLLILNTSSVDLRFHPRFLLGNMSTRPTPLPPTARSTRACCRQAARGLQNRRHKIR